MYSLLQNINAKSQCSTIGIFITKIVSENNIYKQQKPPKQINTYRPLLYFLFGPLSYSKVGYVRFILKHPVYTRHKSIVFGN